MNYGCDLYSGGSTPEAIALACRRTDRGRVLPHGCDLSLDERTHGAPDGGPNRRGPGLGGHRRYSTLQSAVFRSGRTFIRRRAVRNLRDALSARVWRQHADLRRDRRDFPPSRQPQSARLDAHSDHGRGPSAIALGREALPLAGFLPRKRHRPGLHRDLARTRLRSEAAAGSYSRRHRAAMFARSCRRMELFAPQTFTSIPASMRASGYGTTPACGPRISRWPRYTTRYRIALSKSWRPLAFAASARRRPSSRKAAWDWMGDCPVIPAAVNSPKDTLTELA